MRAQRHQVPRHYVVTNRHINHRVEQVGHGHRFDVAGHQAPVRQVVIVVAGHGCANRRNNEFMRRAARRPDAVFDELGDLVEVHRTRVDLTPGTDGTNLGPPHPHIPLDREDADALEKLH